MVDMNPPTEGANTYNQQDQPIPVTSSNDAGRNLQDTNPSSDLPLDAAANASSDQTPETNSGAVGEPGLPPPRVALTSSPSNGVQAQQSGGISSPASRNTASTSLASRTHAPSLPSRAFMAPMSSQRLQAHRGQRPTSQVLGARVTEEREDTRSVTNRNSTGSVVTTKNAKGQTVFLDLDSMPPPSRGTEYSEWSNADRTMAYTELMSSATASKRQESLEPLQNDRKQDQYPPLPSQVNGDDKGFPATGNGHERTPKAFISNIKRVSGQAASGIWTNGHTKLPSGEPTPDGRAVEAQKSTHEDLGANYEYFQGNAIFFCGGRLRNARDKPIVVITAVLFIIPSILFFAFSAPWLWHHVSPALPIFYAYVFFICTSSFYHASLSEPGILPRNLHAQPPPPTDPWAPDTSSSQWVMVKSSASPNGAFEIPVKYCKTCNIWRPPRCHHCRACDSCIDTQDHHCMWLNNCVGRRNYRYFFGFVASGSLLGIYLWAASIGHVIAWKAQNNASFGTAVDSNRVPFAMFIYGLITFLYPSALCSYHIFLLFSGLSTREFLHAKQFLKKDRHRPFRQTPWWKNFVVTLMRPRPPTYMEFKKDYQAGDQRLGERRSDLKKPPPPQHLQPGAVEHEMRQLDNSGPTGRTAQNAIGVFQGPRSKGLIDATPRDDIDQTGRTSMATSKA